jgi:dTDP-4-dehydrorhamnose reductase
LKILLTGRDGQVGWELARSLKRLGEVIATGRGELELAEPDSIRRIVREVKPQVIVNAAAYTAVDKAESEPQIAMRINGEAPGILAEEAKRLDALLVHYSTDYVFDGTNTVPYKEADTPNPLSVYGRSKLEGEKSVRAAGCRALTLRTSWIYAARGRNFVQTILGKARQGAPLRVVDDQNGCPTWAHDVALLTATLLSLDEVPDGLFHAASMGTATWFQVAVAAVRLAGLDVPITPIRTAEYPTAAVRPSYSVLDSSLLPRIASVAAIGDWRARLAACLGAAPSKAQ